jgi:hypothetical protein
VLILVLDIIGPLGVILLDQVLCQGLKATVFEFAAVESKQKKKLLGTKTKKTSIVSGTKTYLPNIK